MSERSFPAGETILASFCPLFLRTSLLITPQKSLSPGHLSSPSSLPVPQPHALR